MELKGNRKGYNKSSNTTHTTLERNYRILFDQEGDDAAKHLATLRRGDKAETTAEEKELIGQAFFVSALWF